MNLPNHIPSIEGMDQAALLARRQVLVVKSQQAPLPDDELEELVAIIARLRQQSSGPPKQRAKPGTRISAPPITLDDIPG